MKGPCGHQEIVGAADTLDLGHVTYRESVRVGSDEPQHTVVGRKQHAGQKWSRIVVGGRAHDLIETGDEIGRRDGRLCAADRRQLRIVDDGESA